MDDHRVAVRVCGHFALQAAGVTDVLATLCAALGVDPTTENTSNTGRPIKIVDLVEGAPIDKLLA